MRSHSRVRSGLSGSGRSRAQCGSRRTSAMSNFMSSLSSPSSSWRRGSATARTTSSRSKGVTFSTTQVAGMPAPAASFTYRLRISTTPSIWISCTVWDGNHNARLGGTIQARRGVRTRIVPSTA
ncbi:hypothetical protein D3C83_11290 [compost metagenome]